MPLLLLICIPLAAALISLPQKKKAPLEIIALAAAAAELACAVFVAAEVINNSSVSYGKIILIDALGALFLCTIGAIGLSATAYSIGYLREEVTKGIIGFRRVREYYVLLHLFLAAMFFAVSTVNPIMMWIAIEATTLSTAFLISFYNKASSTEAAWKYLIINSVGLLLGFFGTLLFFTSALSMSANGFISWSELRSAANNLNPLIAKMALIFVMTGYGTKVGLVPMHTWLPDAHSKAPTPISALLSGVLLSVAFYAILRFKAITDNTIGPAFSRNLLLLFGSASLIVSAFIIYIQNNYKRLLAYSSIEHMGIVAIGFGFGGAGIFAALLHIIYHALIKSTLFFCAGNVVLKYSSTKISKIRGLMTTMPVTGSLFFTAFLAITGVPPFGTFVTEFYILSAGMAAHPAVVVVALAALALIFVGFLKHVSAMSFGETESGIKPGEFNLWTVVPPAIIACVMLALSLYLPPPVKSLLQSAASLIR